MKSILLLVGPMARRSLAGADRTSSRGLGPLTARGLVLSAAAMQLAVPSLTWAASRTLHVQPGADPANASEGSSWEEPTNLQRALALAAPGDEVWVASGVYYPDEGQGQSDNDRESTFQLRDGVAVYGGFAGSETSLTERDLDATPPSVLSGDLMQDDPDEDGNGILESIAFPNTPFVQNALHVVDASGVSPASTLLDGFTVTAGRAHGIPPIPSGAFYEPEDEAARTRSGGGMLINGGSPTVKNCRFVGNSAWFGGAVATYGSGAVFSDCFFGGNQALHRGGAAYIFGSSPTGGLSVYRSQFEGNAAPAGGAVANVRTTGLFANCILTLNQCALRDETSYFGSGFYNEESSPEIVACTLAGNGERWEGYAVGIGENFGAAIYNTTASSPKVTNTIIYHNAAGSVYNVARNAEGSLPASTPEFQNCCIEGSGGSGAWDSTLGIDGGANTDRDPEFIQIEEAYGGFQILWIDYEPPVDLRLRPASVCIDAADAELLPPDFTDLDADGDTDEPIPIDSDGNPRVFGPAPDIGAFELQRPPDPAVTGTPALVRLVAGTPTYEAVLVASEYFDSRATSFAVTPVEPAGLLEAAHIDPLTGALDLIPSDASFGSGTLTVTASTPAGFSASIPVAFEVAPPRLYVDASATGDGTGLTWEHAFTTLQDALVDATDYEVWVASGVYYPDEGGGMADGDREATFSVPDGVRLYGGFAGGEMTLAERDVLGNPPSVLSGDISQDDRNDDGNAIAESASDVAGENSQRVVEVESVATACLLDGFTVTAGVRGITNAAADSKFVQCAVAGNQVGGFRSSAGGSRGLVVIDRCTIAGNGSGSAIMLENTYQPNSNHDLAVRNSLVASNGGFAVAAYGSSEYVFVEGEGLKNGQAIVMIENCTVVANGNSWGSTFDFVSADISISNSIVWDNAGEGWATPGSGSLVFQSTDRKFFSNSIVEDTGGSGDWIHDGSPEVPTRLRNLVDLGGNLDVDPQFVDPAAGDYRLAPGSPGINAGGPLSGIGAWDLGGGMRTLGPAIDIGAYEFYDPATADSDRDGWTDEVELAVDGTATGLPFPQTWTARHEDPDDGLVYPVIGLRADARVIERFDIFIDHAVSLEQDTAWTEIEPALLSYDETGGTVEAEFLAPAPAGTTGYFRLRMQLR